MGALWLGAGVAFEVAALVAGLDRPRWLPVAMAAAALSLTISILAAPDALVGVAVNLLIIPAILFVTAYRCGGSWSAAAGPWITAAPCMTTCARMGASGLPVRRYPVVIMPLPTRGFTSAVPRY